jgi:hypothetical protein
MTKEHKLMIAEMQIDLQEVMVKVEYCTCLHEVSKLYHQLGDITESWANKIDKVENED